MINLTNVTPKPCYFAKGAQRPVVGAVYVCSAYNRFEGYNDDVVTSTVKDVTPINGTNVYVTETLNSVYLVQVEVNSCSKRCYFAKGTALPVVGKRYNCHAYDWDNYSGISSVTTSTVKEVTPINGTNVYVTKTLNSVYLVQVEVNSCSKPCYVAIAASVPIEGMRYDCDVIDRYAPDEVATVSTSRVLDVTVLENSVYRVETVNSMYIVHVVDSTKGNKPHYFAKACPACPTVGKHFWCYALNRWNGESDFAETSSVQAIERIAGTDFYRVSTRNSVYILRPYARDNTKPCFFASGSVVPEAGKRCVCNAFGRFSPNVIEEVSTGAVISVERLFNTCVYRVETENSIYMLTVQ